jgi:hypothetical protein
MLMLWPVKREALERGSASVREPGRCAHRFLRNPSAKRQVAEPDGVRTNGRKDAKQLRLVRHVVLEFVVEFDRERDEQPR